ncbi:MAG: DUF1018 domain-containing protein [Sterolibacterium sp.]|nr:DUF1018 domain-containing protein [Sterolibacterium sp.]
MPAKPKSARNSELAAIHCAKKELGLDDETYRDMLWTIARVRSAGDLGWTDRKRVLDHLKSRGASGKTNEWSFIERAAEDRKPLLRKICAVCRAMKVGKRYAEGVALTQHGVARRLEMMDYSELWKLAGALSRTQMFKAKNAPPPDGGIDQGKRS